MLHVLHPGPEGEFKLQSEDEKITSKKRKEIVGIARTVHEESVAETGEGVWCPSPVKSGGSSCS